MRLLSHRHLARLGLAGLLSFSTAANAHAQISLATAINLALKNSPRVKLAQADVTRAEAALAESKDAFIPSVAASGGVGKATGAPLNPPVVFSIAAQSLVFNSSQLDYIRAARAGLTSARVALDAVRSDTVEDVTNTYLALDSAQRRYAVGAQALDASGQLVSITQDRFNAGVDPHIEVTKSRHTEAQIRLQQLLGEDEIASQADHLARLTGLSARNLQTVPSSVPALPSPGPVSSASDDPDQHAVGLSAAFATAQSKQFAAHAEKHYILRPQVAFSANYSRISTAFTTYTQYYPGYGAANNSFNSLNLGVEITVPILDFVHRAKAHEAAAEAAHSLFEAQSEQMQFLEGRTKLRHSTAELAARRDLAQLDQELAQDQLDAILVRLQAAAGATQTEQLSPKDEKNARLQERLRTLDELSAELQLKQAEVTLMRQEGTLSQWLAGAVPASPNTPAIGGAVTPSTDSGAAPHPPVAPTVGTEPAGNPPSPTTVPSTPTTGYSPATLPAGPVTNPTPAAPPGTPSTTPHP